MTAPDQGPGGYGSQPGHHPQAQGSAPAQSPSGFGHPGYGPPVHDAPGYDHRGYGPVTYSAPGYGGPAYGAPGYGAPGYAVPGYGAPGWPAPPGRPGLVTTAAVLGFVAGALTAIGSVGFLLAALYDGGDASVRVLVFGLPCAGVMIWGGVRLLQRRPGPVLLVGALAAIGVLLVSLVAGLNTLDADDREGLAGFTVLALVLPVVTAVFAALPAVRGWAHRST